MPFSTFDVDNDNRDGNFEESSCARLYKVCNGLNREVETTVGLFEH